MTATRELYGNINVLPPSAETVMFRTTKERADWYVERNLAAFESETVLRLKFQPKGPGHAEDPYFVQEFKNRCVVCGVTKNLSHHHIVPDCYRRYFPRHSEKSGKWMYDVLLLCGSCHTRYEGAAWEKKAVLAKEYGVDIGGATTLTQEMVDVLKAATALERHGYKIPDERQAHFKKLIDTYFKREVEPQEYHGIRKSLSKAIVYTPMGKLVAEKIKFLDVFAIAWREHFVKLMKPKYLPEGWVVDRMIYG